VSQWGCTKRLKGFGYAHTHPDLEGRHSARAARPGLAAELARAGGDDRRGPAPAVRGMDTDRRQEDTSLGGRVDLLAVAPDGVGVLIELKRGERSRPKSLPILWWRPSPRQPQPSSYPLPEKKCGPLSCTYSVIGRSLSLARTSGSVTDLDTVVVRPCP
jgi:hypothetical protein